MFRLFIAPEEHVQNIRIRTSHSRSSREGQLGILEHFARNRKAA
jgi:hypothetical protein